MKMSPLILFVLFLSLATSANAVEYTCGTFGVNNSCTPAALNSLINSASDGDTIHIAQATHDFSSSSYSGGIVINKRLIISGGGSCPNCGDTATPGGNWPTTIDTQSSRNQVFIIRVSTSGNETVRITGIRFYGLTDHEYVWWSDTRPGAFIVESATNIATYRIDNNQFQNRSSGFSFQASDIQLQSMVYGLVDHNFFNHNSWDGHMIKVHRIDVDNNEYTGFPSNPPAGSTSITQAPNWGSANFVFVENNTHVYNCDAAPQLGRIFGPTVIDSFNGGRNVFRHNYVRNGMWAVHDLTGGDASRGGIASEIYNNTFDWEPCGPTTRFASAIVWRSGALLIHNNDFGSSNWQYIVNTFYDRHSSWGNCSLSNVYDAPNSCLDQPGRVKASGNTVNTIQPQALEPARIWSNNGSPSGGCNGVIEHGGWVCNKSGGIVVNGRDYIYSSNNTAKPSGYAPYTYPHPLSNSEVVTGSFLPPTDLRIVNP